MWKNIPDCGNSLEMRISLAGLKKPKEVHQLECAFSGKECPDSKWHRRRNFITSHKEVWGRGSRALRLGNSADQHHLAPGYSLLSAQPPSCANFLPDAKVAAKLQLHTTSSSQCPEAGRGRANPVFSEQGNPSLDSAGFPSHLIT